MILGIIYNEKGKIVNHRSLIKVILNPFLRLIGFEIGSLYDVEKNEIGKVKLFFTHEIKWTFNKYKLPKNWNIKKERKFI